MGIIKPEAQRAFFADHSGNAELLKLFLNGFDISFACERHLSNTTVYAYILKPEDFMRESFGFDKEMLLVYSPFSQMESRSIQAIDELYRVYPFAGRVDTLTCFFMSDDSEVESWIKASASNEAMRILIPFSSQEAAANKSDQWYIRNKLRKSFLAWTCSATPSPSTTTPTSSAASRSWPGISTPSSAERTGVSSV